MSDYILDNDLTKDISSHTLLRKVDLMRLLSHYSLEYLLRLIHITRENLDEAQVTLELIELAKKKLDKAQLLTKLQIEKMNLELKK